MIYVIRLKPRKAMLHVGSEKTEDVTKLTNYFDDSIFFS